MPKVKRIDHVAILVDDMKKNLSFWQDGLGIEFSHIEDVPAEKSMVAFLPVGENEIELVKPTTDEFWIGTLSRKAWSRNTPYLPGS